MDRDPLDALTCDYPKRWHLEEFFNFNQALGWRHAGTLNLNVRYGQMSKAMLAQAAIRRLRTRLGEPFRVGLAARFGWHVLRMMAV